METRDVIKRVSKRSQKGLKYFKIGSGDITWHEIIRKISKKKKPVILATGASSLLDVKMAVKEILKFNKKLILMQCNTNYTASNQNHNYLNLSITCCIIRMLLPDMVLETQLTNSLNFFTRGRGLQG